MKIGILTHYYKSVNYGGNLQAYALCRALQDMGHDAQQVQISMTEDCQNLFRSSGKRWVKKLKKCGKASLNAAKYILKPSYRNACKLKKERFRKLEKVFYHFNRERIRHSEKVYTDMTVHKALSRYDMFITGSDQVWNPVWYFPPYFLNFVPSCVPKLAYAASIGHTCLPEKVRKVYRERLKDFLGVSVREQDAVSLLEGVAPGPVECVLDPTLLLSREQWQQVAAPAEIQKPYMFCYFLGNGLKERQTAAEFAAANGLQLVTIPNATGLFHSNDADFGDVRLEDPSVEAFLGLIESADFVCTDSFHATVFSLIFHRQFAVFPRQGKEQMGSRVYSLLDMFDAVERFCDAEEKICLSYMQALPAVDYHQEPEKFATAKETSLAFLKGHLQKAEAMLGL